MTGIIPILQRTMCSGLYHRHNNNNNNRRRNRPRPHILMDLVVIIALTLLTHQSIATANTFTSCGGVLKEPRGVVQSPGFPGPFPLPISCRWVIQIPPEKKAVLYFTQYFLREAFYVTEYEHYYDELSYSGKKSLGKMNFEDYIHTVVAYRPYLVLDFRLHKMSNIHLRVEEHLEDVYGFNITYEIVDRAERIRQDTCSVNVCSFLGHCVAAGDFSRYWCECFPGFFGKMCQYGPFCDPDKGINMCYHQGRCRYFYGSMVNVCDCRPGYMGPMCEHHEDSLPTVSNSTAEDSLGAQSPECTSLGCTDQCKRSSDGHLYCACREGFKLAQDNITCVEEHLYRVSVSVPLAKRPADWDVQLAATKATSILHLFGLQTAQRFQFDGVNSTGDQDLLLMHFYVDRDEEGLVQVTLDNLFHNGFHNLSFVSDNYTLHLDPGMRLLSLENYVAEPALEGKSLTLVCTARGSSGLQFRWYKDRFLFNASLTSRSAWEVRIQDEFDDKQMSIFNVDGVTMFDKGTFYCEIEDFGEVQNQSLSVDVIPLPQVEIKPLVASVLRSHSLSFRCISYDENTRTFSYQWLRDGQLVTEKNNVNGEQVEDLLPSGSRLYIPRLVLGANYTCRVLNKAGLAQMSARVYLIEPDNAPPTCESTSQAGVKWNRTFGGYFDLQQCPIETAEFNVVGLEEGYARRDCVCDAGKCGWGPPNYAKCHSGHLIYLYEQLERCQLGYQDNDLGLVWDSLYEILHKARNRTLAGDVDMFALNLHTLLHITRNFPAVAPAPSRSSFSLMTVASFMDMLLGEVHNTNDFEKKDLSVGARFLRVCEILAELSRHNSSVIPLFNLTLPRIAFAVRNMPLISHNASSRGSDVDRMRKSGEDEVKEGHQSARHLRSVSVSNSLNTEDKAIWSEAGHVRVLQVTLSPAIFPLLPVHTRSPEFRQFLTPLVSVLPLDDEHEDDEEDDDADDPDNVKVRRVELDFAHAPQFPSIENITKCVAWDRTNSRVLVGEWNSEVCDVILRGTNRTRCLCPLPGHYAVALGATNTSMGPLLQTYPDTVLLVGCMLCMCGLLATLLLLIIYWRHMSSYSSVIHVNFIVALTGINLVCLLCLSHPHRQTLCLAGKLCLHFLQLAAFTFLLMEATHTYVCIQSGGLAGLTRVKYTYAKYCLVGWGVPSLATMAVVLLSEIFGYDKQCSTWCWWSTAQWQHLSFLVPLVVMVMVQIFIITVCLVSTRKWSDEHRFRDRNKYRYIAVRSLVLQGLVVLLSVSGHLTELRPSPGRQWFFVLIDICLMIVVVVTLLFFKPHVRRLVYSVLLPAHKRALASGSFRAFVLPDRVEDTEQAEVKRIQQFCSEHDRSKFTTQHKETLRTLLGSSTPGSQVSGTVSPASSSGTSAVHTLPGPSGQEPSSSCSHSSWNDSSAKKVILGNESRRTPVRKTRAMRGDPREKRRYGREVCVCERCEHCGETRDTCREGTNGNPPCGGCDEGETYYYTRCGRGDTHRRELCAVCRAAEETCAERYEGETKTESKPRGKHGGKTCGGEKTRTGKHRAKTCGLCRDQTLNSRIPPHRIPAHRLLALCEAKLGLRGTSGNRELCFRDSGYEGTESDSHSFPPSSSLDQDSPASSRSDLTGGEDGGGRGRGGGGDTHSSPSPSSSQSSPEGLGLIPRIALLAATPVCSPGISRRTMDSAAVGEERRNRNVVTVDVNNCDVTEDRDVTCLMEDVPPLPVQVEEAAATAEYESLLNPSPATAEYESLLTPGPATAEDLQQEHDTFL